jgi:RNA polymerase sigma-70 factor (ECF subfamily)
MDPDVPALLREGRRNEAFEALVAAYRNKVFRLAYSIVGTAATAEELAQDVFLRVWQVLDSYDGRAAPGTWIYAITRNMAINHLRSASYRRTSPLAGIDPPAPVARSDDSAEDVRRMLQRLPEELREAVTLYYLQERSITEVAAMLNLPEGTVKSHLYRARKALANMLNHRSEVLK